MKKRKRCWFCALEGNRKTFRNRTAMRAHIYNFHGEDVLIASFRKPRERYQPNVLHYGARMRKKLHLEYNKDGHLRSTLEPV